MKNWKKDTSFFNFNYFKSSHSLSCVMIMQVASYTGERRAISEYHNSLNKAYHSGVQEGLVSGLSMGVFFFVFYSSYALAIWYGAKMILDHKYTGGDVMNVMMSTLTGSL